MLGGSSYTLDIEQLDHLKHVQVAMHLVCPCD